MNTKHQLALRRAREILLSIDRDTLINDLLDTEYDETEQTVDEFFDNVLEERYPTILSPCL